MGTQQSGILNLKIADVVKDGEILTSATADGLHDFHGIAFVQQVFSMLAAGYQFFIDLYRISCAFEGHAVDQGCQGQVVIDAGFFAVYRYIHGRAICGL